MKNLLVILSFLFFVQVVPLTFTRPAFAARMVPGTVPQTQPLLPPPAGINVNASNNIQSGTGAVTAATDTLDSTEIKDGKAVANQKSVGLDENASAHGGPNWILLILVFLGAGIIVWQGLRSKNGK